MATLTPEAIRSAADILGLADRASIIGIQSQYRLLVKEWHPDVSEHEPGDAHQAMVRINDAYRLLMEYCMQFEISFNPEDLRLAAGTTPRQTWMEQYGDDPIWGPYRSSPRQRRQ